MPIPPRFQLSQPDPAVIAEMYDLCDRIADELETGGEPTELLANWHKHAGRQYTNDEFTNYWKSTSKEEFVRGALTPTPRYNQDLKHSEVVGVLKTVKSGEIAENLTHYFLDWLDAQFPNANISDCTTAFGHVD